MIIPWSVRVECPKCLTVVLDWTWHADSVSEDSCSTIVVDHLHGQCRCGYQVLMEPADAEKQAEVPRLEEVKFEE